MARVIFELTAAEKQQLEADLRACGCGSPLTPVNEKHRYLCEEIPGVFFHVLPKWTDCIVHSDPWVVRLGDSRPK